MIPVLIAATLAAGLASEAGSTRKSSSEEDWIECNGRRYTVVLAPKSFRVVDGAIENPRYDKKVDLKYITDSPPENRMWTGPWTTKISHLDFDRVIEENFPLDGHASPAVEARIRQCWEKAKSHRELMEQSWTKGAVQDGLRRKVEQANSKLLDAITSTDNVSRERIDELIDAVRAAHAAHKKAFEP
jgi:hypothetical protein